MENPQERLVSKEFVAGLIVGEGWFGLTVQKTPRLKMKYGFTIRPRFALQMNDTETMEMVIASMKAWDLPVWVEKTRKGTRIAVGGMKRTKRIAEFFIPLLTGEKRKAAEIVKEFAELRLSKPQNAPYGEDEFHLVERIRGVNFQRFPVISTGELRDVRLSQAQ